MTTDESRRLRGWHAALGHAADACRQGALEASGLPVPPGPALAAQARLFSAAGRIARARRRGGPDAAARAELLRAESDVRTALALLGSDVRRAQQEADALALGGEVACRVREEFAGRVRLAE